MKVIAALFCLMVGGVLCFAPPLYGPYPTTSTSGGGSATNVVLRGAVAGLITTNGTGDWTLTGNAATATWATNLNAPRSVSEVLVSHPTTDSVTSYWGFKYSETANKSSLTLGEAEDAGNPLAKRGELYFYDPITEVNASLSVTNGLLYSEYGLILKDGSSGELRAVINGTYVRIMKPEQHSPAEKIVYWGTPQLAAQAWLVGTTEEGITNGRFSWLFGDIGPSWNLQRTTNALLGTNYLTGAGATNVTSWLVGNNAGALRSVVSYNSDADRHIIGGTSRGLSVLGTNVVLSVGTNSITVATNQITILGDTYLGSEAYGMSGLSFWDSLEANYRDFRYDVDLECFRLAGGFAAVGNIVALSSGVFYGNGAGITNINAANISGDLVGETLTVATQYVTDSIIGNGSGLTNVLGTNIVYYTNAIADMSVIDMTKPYAAISTNNNFVISGLSGLVAAGNQVQWATRFYTNTSGSTKTITVPAGWVDIGNNGTTIYNTNQGVLSVTRYPGFGTNFVWRGK